MTERGFYHRLQTSAPGTVIDCAVHMGSALHLTQKVLGKTAEIRVKKHNIQICPHVLCAEGKEREK